MDDLNSLQDDVILSNSLSQNELQALKISISIAKYSVLYWAPVEVGGLGNKVILIAPNRTNDNSDLITLREVENAEYPCWCGHCDYEVLECICGGTCDIDLGTSGLHGPTTFGGTGDDSEGVGFWRTVAEGDVWGAISVTAGMVEFYYITAPLVASGVGNGAIAYAYATGIGGASLEVGISYFGHHRKKRKNDEK